MTGLHTLLKTTRRSQRVGRGGKRGKTSGRGTKGQKARAGHRIRPEMRDYIKKLPKRRGHGKNRARTVWELRPRPQTVSLTAIAALFEAGDTVTPRALIERGVVRQKGGGIPQVKLLAGKIDKKISVAQCLVSDAARTAIEKVGGSVA